MCQFVDNSYIPGAYCHSLGVMNVGALGPSVTATKPIVEHAKLLPILLECAVLVTWATLAQGGLGSLQAALQGTAG